MCPDLDDVIGAAADDVDAVVADVDGVDGVRERAVQLTDQRPVERLPEPDLAVGAGRDDLVFQWVVGDVLEERVDTQHVTTRPLPAVHRSQHRHTVILTA